MSDEAAPKAAADAKLGPIAETEDLKSILGDSGNEGRVIQTRLKASNRVIARVTDGIYRHPASALRELISNAWDADANLVTILTDAPRFSRIHVRDDGNGMSFETLARLVHSIGGSAKRSEEGADLGITAQDDPDRTPGGRLLIGKIGIGLFSVSQLSRRFRIITKAPKTNYRLVAEVRLRTYSEDGTDDAVRESSDSFMAGDVFIIRESTDDFEAHGTDVILDDVKPGVRDLLRSADRWRAVQARQMAEASGTWDEGVDARVEPPVYHSGWIEHLEKDSEAPVILARQPNLPWGPDDPPESRMGLLVDAVEREFSRHDRPDLATTLDTYLEMLWTLGLAVPVKYVDRHPFDLTAADRIRLFWLSNEPRGQAHELNLGNGQSVREAVRDQVSGSVELRAGHDAPAGEFRVVIDGVEVKRPIRYQFRHTDRRGLDTSLLFVGHYEPNLSRFDPRYRGGDLALEGYLFWTGRVIPKENNGVLVRIRGTSGALFDTTFFNYQVSEQTRLKQITSELFIQQGLDAALNIDRESFNFSHPHVQMVGSWMHRAIRQLTNKHKEITKRLREQRQHEERESVQDALARHSARIWEVRRGLDEPIPDVSIATDQASAQRQREEGFLVLSRSHVPSLATGGTPAERKERDMSAEALVRILSAYGVLEDRTYEEQQELVEAILSVFYGTFQ